MVIQKKKNSVRVSDRLRFQSVSGNKSGWG